MTPLEFELSYGVEKPASDDSNIVFSCRTGIRSRLAMETLHHLGFEKSVYPLLNDTLIEEVGLPYLFFTKYNLGAQFVVYITADYDYPSSCPQCPSLYEGLGRMGRTFRADE